MRTVILDLRALTALNWPFLVAFLVLWNVGCGLAFVFGAPSTAVGRLVGGTTSLLAGLVALAIVVSSSFRELVTHPRRRGFYRPRMFLVFSAIAAIIGLVWVGAGIAWS